MKNHSHGDNRHNGFGGGDFDGDDQPNIDHGNLGLGRSIDRFINLVDAIIADPDNRHVTAGQNGADAASSNVFWTYGQGGSLHVAALSGFLTPGTDTGTGGFSLDVRADGTWTLRFDGSDTVIGSAGCDDETAPPPPPPVGNTLYNVPGTGAVSNVDGTAGHLTIDGGNDTWDTIQGGIGDYMIGGAATNGGGLAGQGNCAIYSKSLGSVLVDMQNGFGYGGTAEGNVLVNMNQVRGSSSAFGDVLIGNSSGTDLKSGANNSILISTGGTGFELRPDGYGNVLVSTVGADRIAIDPTHGWVLGDDNIVLGFDTGHGDTLDLTVLMKSDKIVIDATNINDFVRIDDQADGSHVLFSPTGSVQTAGVEMLDMKFVHGLDVSAMYAAGQITA